MDGRDCVVDLLNNHCDYYSKKEADETSKEDEFHQAGFSRN